MKLNTNSQEDKKISDFRDESKELLEKQNLAVKYLKNISDYRKRSSWEREVLNTLYDILKKGKAEFDNVCKKIGELDKRISDLENSFSKINMNNLSAEIANSIIESYKERDQLLKKGKEFLEKEQNIILSLSGQIKAKMQEFVRVLDGIFCNTYTIYTGQNANRNYTVLC